MLASSDNIKIVKVNLSGEDNYVLSQMYLPLIGILSFSAYYLLNNVKENETSVRRLVDVLGLKSINHFDQALARLEGIGLLKRFQKKDKGYILECISPLSQKGFLNNSLLREYLVAQIGDVEVHTLESNQKNKKVVGYQEVTKRFDEVYKTNNLKTKSFDLVDEKLEDNIRIKNENFDYLIFKLSIDEERIPKEVLDDEDFEKNILKISYQYQLSELEMKEAVEKAIVVDKDLKYEDIAKYAGYIYQNKVDNKVLGFDVKEPLVYEHNLTSDEEQLVVIADNSTITQMLEDLYGTKAALAEVKDYIKIADVFGLPQGVINVLALYINQTKPDENVSYSYLEKVVSGWKKAGVKTTLDAVKWLNDNKDKKEKVRKKKQVDEPEWMKRDEKVKQQIINQEMTAEEIEEAKALAKKLLG